MSPTPEILRYTAFSDSPDGGNPAGVVLDAKGLDAEAMQQIAADLGYSETAFLTNPTDPSTARIRYFAPEGEVDFCGHATIAAAVALGHTNGPGTYTFATNVGPIIVTADKEDDGQVLGSLESPPLASLPLAAELLTPLLDTFGWTDADLHPDYPPAIGYGGNKHPVLVLRDVPTLAGMTYDFTALQDLTREHQWVTIQACTPTGPHTWRARNPFPFGGVHEDPATGAAAAALAAYLRGIGKLQVGDQLTIQQGIEMGRPSTLYITLQPQTALITGAAVPLNE
ncbi:PhzF family phenazine biosynthesis protein [Ornithinimicrobium panacihumi]|uniref:PhzF family phenazine biosynthesis protein n=1 Tax=Ornithinimicrobium panacihumi TaxID=2008449 RepID=UPI003F8B2B44